MKLCDSSHSQVNSPMMVVVEVGLTLTPTLRIQPLRLQRLLGFEFHGHIWEGHVVPCKWHYIDRIDCHV